MRSADDKTVATTCDDAQAVSYLSGNLTYVNLQCLLKCLRRPSGLSLDFKTALLVAIRPVPRWRKNTGWAVITIDPAAHPSKSTEFDRNTFALALHTRNGRPPQQVREQNFLGALGIRSHLPVLLDENTIIDANRSRFAHHISLYIEHDLTLRRTIADALEPQGTSRFKLMVEPRVKRRPGRIPNKEAVEWLKAQIARAELDEATGGIVAFPEPNLDAVATRLHLAPRTVKEKVRRLAPRKR